MNPVQRIALLFLTAVTFFSWGVAMAVFEVFPHRYLGPAIDEVSAWLGGVDEGEQLTLTEKIGADFFGQDTRYFGHAAAAEKLQLDLKTVTDPRGLLSDSKMSLKYVSSVDSGYFVFFTVLNLPDAKFGAVIVSAQGELMRIIKVPEASHALGQGAVTEDGNFVFASDDKLTVSDICGRVRYSRSQPGDRFHHRASGYDDKVWIWNEDDAVRIDVASGEVIKQFSLVDLLAANEDLPIFEARLLKKNLKDKFGRWQYSELRDNPDIPLEAFSLEDPFHHNDVDALSPAMAPLFPDFSVGDLLLSFRSINLVVVVDPDTLKVKWFTYGEFSRQHDPDWGYNGEIIVYDNKSHSTKSRILSFDTTTRTPRVLVDGESLGFYQFAGGNQHVHTDGKVLLMNGPEALYVDTGEQLVFYFQNQNQWKSAASITTVHYLTETQFSELTGNCSS